MNFRLIIFWLHLVCGVIASVSIGIMCLTGTVLAFEKELAAWSERDARQVQVPDGGTPRISADEAQRRLREAFPEARPATLVVQRDPAAAFAFPGSRGTAGYYVNPYTGEVRQPQSTLVGGFMQTMITWHRYLGLTGTESRPRGKWINGACNLAFCLLAITGLYLWMPRNWSLRSVKAVAVFNRRLTGRARDFNWHNVIGLWSAPVLIVLTLTAVPISFQWGGRVIASLVGTPSPSGDNARTARTATAQAANLSPSTPSSSQLSDEVLIGHVQRELPDWTSITLRFADRGQSGGPRGAPGRAASDAGSATGASGGSDSAAPTATFTVREAASWPRTATTTVTLNRSTGETVDVAGYAQLAPSQQVRAWTRFLHTGEALGWWGQLVAGLACAGGCVLVWTGLALAWRRFFGKANANSNRSVEEPTTTTGVR